MAKDYSSTNIPLGWQCPVCKRIYPPSAVTCLCCEGEDININTAEDTIKKFLSNEAQDFAKQYLNTLKDKR